MINLIGEMKINNRVEFHVIYQSIVYLSYCILVLFIGIKPSEQKRWLCL
ncbi:hypothetical protein HMPREF1565_3659 [Providencia alcalifaciens RIMD 1656011]|nr:hypothetical protein HMPREF1565_3659 [Providencia alcalifaciens RIMD 1656011]